MQLGAMIPREGILGCHSEAILQIVDSLMRADISGTDGKWKS